MIREFKYIEKWLYTEEYNNQKRFKNGVDVGCGTNRIAEDGDLPENEKVKSTGIISIDKQGDPRYASAQLVWNCIDLEIFNDNKLDFIFSSHCLEDFQNISEVFHNWWRKIKPNGLMILLLPDMENCSCEHCKNNSRYPKVEDDKGNPAHRINTGKIFMEKMLQGLLERNKIKYEMLQIDTIPHNESCSIDFVIKKLQ
jgi:predicted SAM-dependent methyltransferase